MNKERQPPQSIDEYIAAVPPGVRAVLNELRATIRKAAPRAEEKIAYRMPTFYYLGNLVHFAAYARHIGFYPTPSAIVEFKSDLKGYVTSKGAIQFPIDKPLPLRLVSRIVRFRVAENEAKS